MVGMRVWRLISECNRGEGHGVTWEIPVAGIRLSRCRRRDRVRKSVGQFPQTRCRIGDLANVFS